MDYLTYYQTKNQFLVNQHLNPDYSVRRPENELKGTLPAMINIYSAKTDFTFPFKKTAKIETGLKTSYVTTDNNALYQNNTPAGYVTDEGKQITLFIKKILTQHILITAGRLKNLDYRPGCVQKILMAISPGLTIQKRADSSFTKII